MKINKTNGTIRLSHDETAKWEDGGPDGYDFRRATKETAHEIADSTRRSVEIYASARDGGWTAEQIEPEPLS